MWNKTKQRIRLIAAVSIYFVPLASPMIYSLSAQPGSSQNQVKPRRVSEMLVEASRLNRYKWWIRSRDTTNHCLLEAKASNPATWDDRFLPDFAVECLSASGKCQEETFRFGISYHWGGVDDAEMFLCRRNGGASAGSHSVNHGKQVALNNSCAAGIDCSGLVSRAWGLPVHPKIGTGDIHKVANQIKQNGNWWDWIEPGDAILVPGHVMLFDHIVQTPKGEVKLCVYEAIGAGVDHTTRRPRDKDMNGATVWRFGNRIEPLGHVVASSCAYEKVDDGDIRSDDLASTCPSTAPRVSAGKSKEREPNANLKVPVAPPCLEVVPRFDLGEVAVGSSKASNIEIRNCGAQAITSLKATISGGDAESFGADTIPSAIGDGGLWSGRVTFSPISSGIKRSTMDLNFEGAPQKIVVKLEGTALSYCVAFAGPSERFDFGSVVLGSESTEKFSVHNCGSVPLRGLVLLVEGANSEEFSGDVPESVESGRTIEGDLKFRPKNDGTKIGHIAVVNERVRTDSLLVSGIGVTACATLDPSTVDFGTVVRKSKPVRKEVLFHNCGSAHLKLSPSLSSQGEVFKLVDVSDTSDIAPNDTVALQVMFFPSRKGISQGTLSAFTVPQAGVLNSSLRAATKRHKWFFFF